MSVGELIDKLTILELKESKIQHPEKLQNIKFEKSLLLAALNRAQIEMTPDLLDLQKKLTEVNETLWEVEDRLRALEQRCDFGKEFIEEARLVYFTNDRRAELKRQLNLLSGSKIVEEKSYTDYRSDQTRISR